jgi:quercetin dioxygenase-like cupin family protein
MLKGDESNQHEPFVFQKFATVVSSPPTSSGPNVKVWNLRQTKIHRVNLVEFHGELSLHKHPDATHSVLILEGVVRVQVGKELYLLNKGDFISIPADVPHKYWSLTENAFMVSTDAPFYDPRKTISVKDEAGAPGR